MKLKKFAAICLAGVLCLTAFTGCGAKAEDTIATLGEQEVTYGVANFMCKYQKAALDDLYTGYFGEDVWNSDLNGYGTTMEDDLKSYVMNTLHDMYTLKAHMEEYGVTITEEEQAKIKEAAAAFMASNSEEALKEFGATEEIVIEVLTLYTIDAKMYEAITAEADIEVSDEEANMRGYSAIVINLKGEYNEAGTLVEYTEEERTAARDKALSMKDALEEKTLEEVAEIFSYEVTTGTYSTYEETSLSEDILTALSALKEGEVSDVIEKDDAIYVLRVDADTDEKATAEKRDAIITQRKSDVYVEKMTKWQENDGWKVNESVLDKIDFHNKFTLAPQTTENVEGTESK